MSSRKNALVLFSLRIKAFPLFIILPLRCLSEVTEGFSDLLCLFGRANKKAWAALSTADDALAMLRSYGSLDLMDVDAGGREARVKFKLLLR
jgi:hypothetical protein